MIIIPLLKDYCENGMGRYVKNLAQTVAVIFQETYSLAVGKTRPWEHVRCAHQRDRGLKYQPKCPHLGSLDSKEEETNVKLL